MDARNRTPDPPRYPPDVPLLSLSLLLPLGCGPSAPKVEAPSDSASVDTASPDCTSTAFLDHDGDGFGAGAPVPACDDTATGLTAQDGDCDDARADVFPGASEVCDGADQDCDGATDEDIPTDGAGCVDTPAPARSALLGTVSVTLRTGPNLFQGTNEPVELCLDGTCRRIDTPDWDDGREGRTDVVHVERWGVPRDEVRSITVRPVYGVDAWTLDCVEVAFDGEPVACLETPTVLGSGRGETRELVLTPTDGCTTSCWGSPLTHGPLLGAVQPSTARIRVRTDATRGTRLFVDGARVATAWPGPDTDFVHVFDVEGLTPGRAYDYAVEIEGTRVHEGTFQTPSAAPAPLRLAFGSCTLFDDTPAFEQIREWAPDVFVFAGDAHYGETSALEAHRAHARAALERPARAALFEETITLATWDDHDFTGNNDAGDEPARAEVLQAFTETWANAAYGTADTPGVFSTWEGNGVQVVLLDVRYWRGLEDSLLGSAQEAWLAEVLQASPAVFHLVVSGSQWTPFGDADSWADYPEAQARVLDALADVPGVVLLDGDIHRAEFRLLPTAGYSLPELTSSPLSNLGGSCPDDPDVIACHSGANYFIGLDIDPTGTDPTLTADLWQVGGELLESWTIRASELR